MRAVPLMWVAVGSHMLSPHNGLVPFQINTLDKHPGLLFWPKKDPNQHADVLQLLVYASAHAELQNDSSRSRGQRMNSELVQAPNSANNPPQQRV